MAFPITRLRRLRQNKMIRNMVRETSLSVHDLIMPYFVCPGENVKNPIQSMPGNYQLSVDLLVEECKELMQTGIQTILLFGIPDHKDEDGSVACEENGIVQRAIRAIKAEIKEITIVADVCNCEYTTHGHCGTIVDGDVDNDLTLKTLAAQSVSLTKAGADIIAPSDMMDGRVAAIRKALDENGFYKRRSWPTLPNMLPVFTAPFAMLQKALHNLAIAALTRWTRLTATRRFVKWNSTSRKVRIL